MAGCSGALSIKPFERSRPAADAGYGDWMQLRSAAEAGRIWAAAHHGRHGKRKVVGEASSRAVKDREKA
jgi:hypothetical protein